MKIERVARKLDADRRKREQILYEMTIVAENKQAIDAMNVRPSATENKVAVPSVRCQCAKAGRRTCGRKGSA